MSDILNLMNAVTRGPRENQLNLGDLGIIAEVSPAFLGGMLEQLTATIKAINAFSALKNKFAYALEAEGNRILDKNKDDEVVKAKNERIRTLVFGYVGEFRKKMMALEREGGSLARVAPIVGIYKEAEHILTPLRAILKLSPDLDFLEELLAPIEPETEEAVVKCEIWRQETAGTHKPQKRKKSSKKDKKKKKKDKKKTKVVAMVQPAVPRLELPKKRKRDDTTDEARDGKRRKLVEELARKEEELKRIKKKRELKEQERERERQQEALEEEQLARALRASKATHDREEETKRLYGQASLTDLYNCPTLTDLEDPVVEVNGEKQVQTPEVTAGRRKPPPSTARVDPRTFFVATPTDPLEAKSESLVWDSEDEI